MSMELFGGAGQAPNPGYLTRVYNGLAGIPMGADPIWQPVTYLIGCAGWIATTGSLHNPSNPETPWLVPLHPSPTANWLDAYQIKDLPPGTFLS